MAQGKGPRPSGQKREPERIAALLEHLRVGASRHDAAKAAGLGGSNTISTWFKRAEGDEDLREICDQIEAAESAFVTDSLRTIVNAGDHSPNVLLKLLGKKRPDEYGERVDAPATAPAIAIQNVLAIANKVQEGTADQQDIEALVRAALPEGVTVPTNGVNGTHD